MDPVRIVKIIWIHMSVLQSLRGTRIISIIIIFYLHVHKTFRITATMEEVFEPLTHSYIGGGWRGLGVGKGDQILNLDKDNLSESCLP